MAHSLSAKKRVRQTMKQRARNRFRKELVKTQLKDFTVAAATGDPAKAEEALKKVASRLDKTVAKGSLHKNTAARKRSRLAKRVNALRKAPAAKSA